LAFQLSASGRTVGLQMPIINDSKLGNCTNPRADYEIQLVGAGFIYTLNFNCFIEMEEDMATFLIAAIIFGSVAYILVKKIMKMKKGDFSCEGCKGGSCSSCSSCSEEKK
jgi:hypothetical protein